MSIPRLFIFPLDMDEAAPLAQAASLLGIQTVGASSAMTGPGLHAINHFLHLPFITDPDFDEAFITALNAHQITDVFTSHQGVWQYLSRLQNNLSGQIDFKLCQPDPFTVTKQWFRLHDTWAHTAETSRTAQWIDHLATPPLSHSCYTALHRLFLNTPGQCDEAKLLALCDIARITPTGDWLEVGSLYGRSALALGYLACRHETGNLICVDPWATEDMTDQGNKAEILNIELDRLDFEHTFRIFLSSVAVLNNVGYIRKTSAAAQAIYESARDVGHLECPELGKIALQSHLSLVHIDGNHRYDHVKLDVNIWARYLLPGGWLLLDDYIWAFGDGPKRVGDELLNSALFDHAFVASDTLFLRRSTAALTQSML